MLNLQNIFDTIDMIDKQHLDIRTITMGISLLDCVSEDPKRCCDKIYDKICRRAEKLVQTGRDIESEFGIPIVNKRISVTPMALVAGPLAKSAEERSKFYVLWAAGIVSPCRLQRWRLRFDGASSRNAVFHGIFSRKGEART